VRRLTLRGLFARRLRFTLTLLAVALGVSLICATYIYTDTINGSFDRIFEETNKGTDVAITPKEYIEAEDGSTLQTVPRSVLQKVRANPDVQAAEGSVFDMGLVLGKDGERIGVGGAPNFITSVNVIPRFRGATAAEGRFPQTADEAVIDRSTAKKEDFKLGDRVTVQGVAPRKDYKLVGFTQVAGVDSFGGATVVGLIPPEAMRMLGKTGYDTIQVAARPGVTPKALAQSLRVELPLTVNVRTGQEQATKDSQDIESDLSFIRTFLLVFGFVSLFVGAFIIFNSFSITIAQRTGEIGLLRALGATRRQVLRSVLAEGVILGVLGSLAGIALGIALAPLLKAMFTAIGIDLPANGLVIESRAIIVPLIVGTIVAVASAVGPSVRATRVTPMAALREAAAPTIGRVSRRLTIVATVLLVIGVALIALGLFGGGDTNSTLTALGFGVFTTFMAVALMSPRLVRPLASVLGRPAQRFAGFPGRLARENAMRQPGRTAATAAALMVGVTLVTFASIFAAGAKATIDDAITNNLKAELVVQNTDGFSPFSGRVMPAVAKVDGVSDVGAVRFSKARLTSLKNKEANVTGVDPATFEQMYKVKVEEGPQNAIQDLAGGSTLVAKKSFAEDQKLDVGEAVTLRTPTRKTLQLRVGGIVKDEGGLIADFAVPNTTLERDFGERKDAIGLVDVAPGAESATVQKRIKALLKARFPEAEVKTGDELIESQSQMVNQLLGLIYGLLSLAVLISLFGIVNTLVLSISERTREIGMLRAVGTTQKQVRKIVRWEAIITAMIGGIIGCTLGVCLAVLFTRPLDGFKLSIPVGQLIVLVLLSGLAGVFAAVWPARRAARLDVIKALAYE
jgi:putative ABC transport system permease protein